jgi:hypothetical protein
MEGLALDIGEFIRGSFDQDYHNCLAAQQFDSITPTDNSHS